jgi:hypothetical protein
LLVVSLNIVPISFRGALCSYLVANRPRRLMSSSPVLISRIEAPFVSSWRNA